MAKFPFYLILAYTFLSLGILISWLGNLYSNLLLRETPYFLIASASFFVLGIFFYFHKRKSLEEKEFQIRYLRLRKREKQVAEREEKIASSNIQLDKKKQELMQKLKTYHEWMEFPSENDFFTPEEEIIELDKRDAEVIRLLERKSEVFFDKFKNRKYHQLDRFHSKLLWDDIYSLVEEVAKIYNPESKNPLLETDVEKLLRAVNQISINLLVILEGLPGNLENYNLREIYRYIERATNVFGLYKNAAPYLENIRNIYYLSMALTGNPIAITARFVAGELGKYGVKKLGIHLSEKYAMNLLGDTLGVVATEVAAIYGGDYRKREASWVFAAELTELLVIFPPSQEVLLKCMQKIGTLPMRSEYDRIYFYRCLAARKSAMWQDYKANLFLSIEEREKIFEFLESVFLAWFPYSAEKDISKWKQGIETRFCLKTKIGSGLQLAQENYKESMLLSLYSFLVGKKEIQTGLALTAIQELELYTSLSDVSQESFLQACQTDIANDFIYPELEPVNPLLDEYLLLLLDCVLETAPFRHVDHLWYLQVVVYFRAKEASYANLLFKRTIANLQSHLLSESPVQRVTYNLAVIVLEKIFSGSSQLFIYKKIRLSQDGREFLVKGQEESELVLVGNGFDLYLFAFANKSFTYELLWQKKREEVLQISKKEKIPRDELTISGIQIFENSPEAKEVDVTISGDIFHKFADHFQLLLLHAETEL
ncbi:MAG: hypothetical protein AAF518_08370 [Spirochaetota bacterium]